MRYPPPVRTQPTKGANEDFVNREFGLLEQTTKSAQTDSSSGQPARRKSRFNDQPVLITQTHSPRCKKGCACTSQSPRANLRDPITPKKNKRLLVKLPATHTTNLASLQPSKLSLSPSVRSPSPWYWLRVCDILSYSVNQHAARYFSILFRSSQ